MEIPEFLLCSRCGLDARVIATNEAELGSTRLLSPRDVPVWIETDCPKCGIERLVDTGNGIVS
jgi:hypothetical protein